MKNILSSLNESEKRRILEMHKNATKKQYLIEQTTTQPQSGTTTQPQSVDGGGTPQEKLQNFKTTQTVGTISSVNQKVMPSSIIVKDVNTKSLQVDANFDTQTGLKARYILQCQPNKKGGFSLATNTEDRLNPESYIDLKTNKEDKISSYGAVIEPKKNPLYTFLNNACNAAFSTQPQKP